MIWGVQVLSLCFFCFYIFLRTVLASRSFLATVSLLHFQFVKIISTLTGLKIISFRFSSGPMESFPLQNPFLQRFQCNGFAFSFWMSYILKILKGTSIHFSWFRIFIAFQNLYLISKTFHYTSPPPKIIYTSFDWMILWGWRLISHPDHQTLKIISN